MNILLWIIQVLLALLFLFGGPFKLIMPMDEVAKQLGMSVMFLRFIGLCETLGGLGLILPGLFRIKPGLTPLAAVLLAIITVGATVVTLKGGIATALMPFVTTVLLVFVAFGRWRLAPHRGR